jgi:hypothetical protein
MGYGVVRAASLSFFADAAEDEDTEIGGPIVISDGERAGEAYAQRPRGAAPQGGAS